MTVFSSLTNRIFFASALLAVVSIGVAMVSVNVAVSRQAEEELLRGLDEAGTALEEYRTALFDHFSREARLVADLPRLKAAVSLKDAPTTGPIAEEYQQQLGADLFFVTDAAGTPLAHVGEAADVPASALTGIAAATKGVESRAFVAYGTTLLQVVSVPVWIDPRQPEILGTLSVGLGLDERAAQQFRELANSEIAFAMNGRLYASTLPADAQPALAPLLAGDGLTRTVRIGDEDYVAVAKPLASPAPAAAADARETAGDTPTAIILRSRTERLRFLDTVHRALGLTALVAVMAATLLSYGVARTVTRPIGAITAAMRRMADTGDLSQYRQPARSRWEDEDARLLASTFASMTDSIGRFQREAAQKERLSSLGRLSTVVAHEIRNPLMIIKSSLRGLRRSEVPPEELREAVSSIDEEVARLDRVVSEVLDYARPIRFEFEPVDINALCHDAARASLPDTKGTPPILWHLDTSLPLCFTDRERLRLALVNILDNARHAVAGDNGTAARGAIAVTTSRLHDSGARIVVHDDGPGIAPEDLSRIFDPYFTTRRTGTGLGLAITRNVIEGLGGTISVKSTPGMGTEVRVDLPPGASEGT